MTQVLRSKTQVQLDLYLEDRKQLLKKVFDLNEKISRNEFFKDDLEFSIQLMIDYLKWDVRALLDELGHQVLLDERILKFENNVLEKTTDVILSFCDMFYELDVEDTILLDRFHSEFNTLCLILEERFISEDIYLSFISEAIYRETA